MGSTLSILNDTQDPWQCKIGPDEAALKIAGIVVSVIGSVATVIGTAGAAAPLAASLAANGVVAVFGVSTSALATITAGAAAAATYASVIGGVSSFGITVAKGLSVALSTDGFVVIAPGQSHQSGKMTLSLWQQGTCVKSVLVDEMTVRIEHCTCVRSLLVRLMAQISNIASSFGSTNGGLRSRMLWRAKVIDS